MIDVHILRMPGENQAWFDQCLHSLKNEPINLHVLDGKKDDLGGARAAAFLVGESPYVSWVDPDDYVLPGGFAACMTSLQSEQSVAACTQEYRTGISGKIIDLEKPANWVHHLIVLRRETVIRYLQTWKDWDHLSSNISEGRYFIEFLVKKNERISFIKKPYYVWRRHSKADSIRRRTHG